MSRLYYDPPVNRGNFASGSGSAKEYLEKVAKLIPSEIIAAYLTIIGLIPAIRIIPADSLPIVYKIVFAICLILTPVYLGWMSDQNKPKTVHLILSAIAFALWAYNISGAVLFTSLFDPAIGAIFLVLFSLVSGKIPLN